MSRSFHYTVCGSASDGQTFAVTGTITVPPGGIREAFDDIMHAAFHSLTHGRAVYGKPGLYCMGPYKFTKITMEEEKGE